MAEYICVKELCLETYDNDGFRVENEFAFVDVGEVFQESEERFRCVGGQDSIRLENDTQWIEISKETLAKHFAKHNTRTPKERCGEK